MTQITEPTSSEHEQIVPADLVCDKLQPWQRLDNVIRMWAAQSGHDNDQEWYKKMKEFYE